MSQITTLARPYAKAAFQSAMAANSLTQWSDMLGLLSALLNHQTIRNFLASPALGDEQQAQGLIDVCGEELSQSGQNFVRLLAEYKRLSLLPEISRLFNELKADQEKTIDVSVISAFAMPKAAEEKLAQALKKHLQREVKLSTSIDQSLIGGVIVHAGDLVIDGSIRGRLSKLAETMSA